jgi:hypothetical protein
MNHSFSQVPNVEIQRSSFDRSHGHKTTFDEGYLVPVFIDEVLPGDTFNLHMTAFARLATPIKPLMDNMFLDSHFFFVPNRLIWDNWEKFNGAQDNPTDSTDFLVPQIELDYHHGASNMDPGTLANYFGLPSQKSGPVPNEVVMVDSLFFRAYNLIYNEWYRSENLQDSVVVDKDNGPDSITDYVLLRRGKRFDYFTSALPWPQKGPDVFLPLGTSAPILGLGNITAFEGQFYENAGPTIAGVAVDAIGGMTATATGTPYSLFPAIGPVTGKVTPGTFYADLTAATAATINDIRQAFQLQKLYEKDARGGTRYTEILRAHFGVTSPDSRLQRPEYLGGGTTQVNIHPVPQTAPTPVSGTPQGNLAAFGTAVAGGHGFVKSFVEHGVIIGIVSVRADLTYQQGLNRMWSRQTREDFYWPSFAHLGEQAVLNKEIYLVGAGSDDDLVFGYQERYAEYRYKPSLVTGLFQSSISAGSLDVWHLSQFFSALPALGPDFIVEDAPVDRVIAVPSEPHFIFDSYFKLITARPMPVYSVPGLVDHF